MYTVLNVFVCSDQLFTILVIDAWVLEMDLISLRTIREKITHVYSLQRKPPRILNPLKSVSLMGLMHLSLLSRFSTSLHESDKPDLMHS